MNLRASLLSEILCVGIAVLLPAAARAETRQSIDADWRFTLGDAPDSGQTLDYKNVRDAISVTGRSLQVNPPTTRPADSEMHPGETVSYVKPGFDDSSWRSLDLPHDFGIESGFKQSNPGKTGKLTWFGVAWYRKHLKLPAAQPDVQYSLDIDGAMSYSMVWCNGHFVGGWPYGYTSYRLDLTPYVHPGGDNVLCVRLDNPPQSSRWYPGGGMYRNIWLVTSSTVHVNHWGTYITTPAISTSAATVHVRTEVVASASTGPSVELHTDLFELDSDGHHVGAPVAHSTPVHVAFGSDPRATVEQDLSVPSPKLWSLTDRHRYVAVTTLDNPQEPPEQSEVNFGIRTTRFDADHGFFLNGQHVDLKGVCDHADLGAIGTAVNVSALARQISILQEMGCNAIRTSHNPPAPELLDLCDRMGMLVMDEAFDCWEMGKGKNDYHVLFDDWHEKDLRALVRRDRNHPCVILWSIGNEIPEQGNANGRRISDELRPIVHEEDGTRPVTSACDQRASAFSGFQKTVDVFGFNYKPMLYAKAHAADPGLPLFGSETASCISSRGEYFFPLSNMHQDFQVSSYDLDAPSWANVPDAEFKAQVEDPYVCGEFVWTGFDYLGEPTPYGDDTDRKMPNISDPAERARLAKDLAEHHKVPVPSRSSYFGIVDLCGFKKDRFYLYQAHWKPDLPMAHLMPHWTWAGREGQVTPVQVYTSGDEAELFVNGISQGRKKRATNEFRLRWDDVKYAPGEINVIAYRNGKVWANDRIVTAGPPAQLQMSTERSTIAADGAELAYITARVVDSAGGIVPRADNHLKFMITGPGEIIATDNGDPTDLTSFQSHERRAFNGMALVIVRSKKAQPGTVSIRAVSPTLKDARVEIRALSD